MVIVESLGFEEGLEDVSMVDSSLETAVHTCSKIKSPLKHQTNTNQSKSLSYTKHN